MGATLVSVESGTFTLQSPAHSGCTVRRFPAGTGVVVPAGQVHRGRNTGQTPLRMLVTYVGLPDGGEPEVSAKRPRGCR